VRRKIMIPSKLISLINIFFIESYLLYVLIKITDIYLDKLRVPAVSDLSEIQNSKIFLARANPMGQ
ncbi:MAG: hypothetical protein LWX52_15975, partial [Deltaproteobacteria bacterium]|nr:hypothetical protein [Deltaproteobacteria bacterium]